MSAATVRVTVNGQALEVEGGTRLVDFLAARGVDSARIAVERNRSVVPRATLEAIVLEDGDLYEVVHFVGGG